MTDYREMASRWTDDINSLTFNNATFCEEMTREHRTLQQSFTRLCLDWLRTCASDDYQYDARNEASHITARDLLAGKENQFLPFI